MSENSFLLPQEEYQRSIDPLNDWVKQSAWYAAKMLGLNLEKCISHLKKKITSKVIEIKNPTVVFYHRGDNGDREKRTAGLTAYLGTAIARGNILAATGTTYLHPSEKRSIIVDYLDENVAIRKKYKKLAQKYEAEGNVPLHKYNHNSQDNAKRDNNAVSGSFVAEGSVIKNKSAHSTLTSTTRSIASLSNSSNERLIEGNRHYYNPDIVIYNIISICSESDLNVIDQAIEAFGLVYPSIEETMNCILRSTDLYYRDRKRTEEIKELVSKLSATERAAFVYTGDLYHIRICNDSFMRTFITDLSAKGSVEPKHEDVRSKIYKTDEQVVNYAHQICLSMLKGKGKDYDKLSDDEANILYNTCLNIAQTIEKYKLFLRAFFLTKNSPPTMASVPRMIRRAVVLSDTDSTMFSVDGWVQWYFGHLTFEDKGYAVGGSVMYMATQSIAHILAQFSANMNVERSRLFSLAMKPEYVFPVFAQTSVAKHYYTAMMVKEGNVYKDIKMEIKGVHMKDSTVPTNIITAAADEMQRIIRAVMNGEELSIYDILAKTVSIEKDILDSLARGETQYLKRIRIKERSAYKNGEGKLAAGEVDKTNYRHYTCWERCFADKYGRYDPPPFSAVTIPLDLPNASAVNAWLASLEDQEFAKNFALWLKDHNMTKLGQLHIPLEHCQNKGIPEELIKVLDSKRIVLGLTRSFRNIIESHGYFSKAETMFIEQLNPEIFPHSLIKAV